MNRLQICADARPRWAKAFSRAGRMMLLTYIPIVGLSPYGMRLLDAYGVEAPASDLVLSGVMALPFAGIFLWTFFGERFWDRVIVCSTIIRFVLEWAFAIFFLEFGIVMLAVIGVVY